MISNLSTHFVALRIVAVFFAAGVCGASAQAPSSSPTQKTVEIQQDLLADARKVTPKKLEEFEQAAAKNNPTLKQAEAMVRASAGLAKQAARLPNPSIGYEGSEIRGGSFHGGEQGGFVQQDIVLGGKLRLRKDVFEQQRRADEIGVEEQKLNVAGAVRVQFYATLTAQRTADVRKKLLELARDASTTAHQLANIGQDDAPDVLQTEVEAEQAQLELNEAEQRYVQEYRILTTLAGEPHLELALLEGNLEHPPEIDGEALLQSLLQKSPSVRRAEQNVRMAEAALKREEREFVPDVTLRAGEQQNNEANASGRPFGAQSFASASVQLPIFNRNQGSIEASTAELERTQNEVARVRLSLGQMAQPMIQQYQAAKLKEESYRTQMIPQAQRAYEMNLQRYQTMAAPYAVVILSQRTLFQLQAQYVRALGELWMTSQRLESDLLTDGLGSRR